MSIHINDHYCQGKPGDRLLDVARANHSHIGYFCGGNGICQTCYVKVLEGHDLLSPLSDPERAMLSDDLVREGTRVGCMTYIEKEGTIRVLSAVEEVKRMYENHPLQLPAYSGKMGWDALVKFPDTIALQWQRIIQGKLDPWQLLVDVLEGIGDALQLSVEAITSAFSPKPLSTAETPAERAASPIPRADSKKSCCVTGNGAVKTSAAVHFARQNGVTCN